MRKIHAFYVTTVDGYYAGPHDEFDWPVVDDEFNEFAVEQLDAADTLLFGRVTYEQMASYWPTPQAVQGDPVVAGRMNAIAKVVVSRTLDTAGWANSRVIKDDAVEGVAALKREPGKDILIFGSSDLTVDLVRAGLVDEVRVMVNPIVLGAGKSLFNTAQERIGLRLLDTRTFKSGNVLLSYQPVAQSAG
jgi:dihydrofolate reductase